MSQYQKKLSNGDMQGTMEYPEQQVEIVVNGDKHIIGRQPTYTVLNIVDKDKVAILKLYLEEQYKEIDKRINYAREAMKPFSGIGEAADKFENCLKLIPRDDKDAHKFDTRLSKTNELADKIIKYLHAKKNLEILEMNISKIKEQLTFIQENYC